MKEIEEARVRGRYKEGERGRGWHGGAGLGEREEQRKGIGKKE